MKRSIQLSPFKLDIDELIAEFEMDKSYSFMDMKRIWLSRKFSFIYEARPFLKSGFFMQSLYTHAIGHMVSSQSLSHRLGGLYCLYCLYETQPFKTPFKIYLYLGELKKLKNLVVEAKEHGIKVACSVVKRMLENNMFLFGFVDSSDASSREVMKELTEVQNAHVKLAYKKLLANTKIEQFIHMNMREELEVDELKRLSSGYHEAKELAVNEGGKMVDVSSITHIVDRPLINDVLDKMVEDWDAQKLEFQKHFLETGPDFSK